MVYSRSLPGLIKKCYNFSQKPVEYQTGTEITPTQCEMLFQDIYMSKSNWGLSQCIFVIWFYFIVTQYNF